MSLEEVIVGAEEREQRINLRKSDFIPLLGLYDYCKRTSYIEAQDLRDPTHKEIIYNESRLLLFNGAIFVPLVGVGGTLLMLYLGG